MKRERMSVHISLDKILSKKIRIMVTNLPGATFNSYLEDLFEREIKKYEDIYGEISEDQEVDFYFNTPRYRGRAMRSLEVDLE